MKEMRLKSIPRAIRPKSLKVRTRARSLRPCLEYFEPLRWFVPSTLAILLLGCQPQVEPSTITAEVVAYGEFEIRGGLPVLAKQATLIECEQGKIFGVDYRIEVADGDYGSLPVSIRWVHPNLAVPSLRLWGPETRVQSEGLEVNRRESGVDGRGLWSLDHVDELVSGRYEFQIRREGDDAPILSQPFDVEGC